jgi:uncharacterized membrane protein
MINQTEMFWVGIQIGILAGVVAFLADTGTTRFPQFLHNAKYNLGYASLGLFIFGLLTDDVFNKAFGEISWQKKSLFLGIVGLTSSCIAWTLDFLRSKINRGF